MLGGLQVALAMLHTYIPKAVVPLIYLCLYAADGVSAFSISRLWLK